MWRFYIIGYAAALPERSGSISINVGVSNGVATTPEELDMMAKAKLFDLFPPSKGWAGHTYVINDVTGDAVNFVLEASRAT